MSFDKWELSLSSIVAGIFPHSVKPNINVITPCIYVNIRQYLMKLICVCCVVFVETNDKYSKKVYKNPK